VCLGWLRRFLVAAAQFGAFVVFRDEPERRIRVCAVEFDTNLVVRGAVGFVLQDAFENISVFASTSLSPG
jgi:hypothetical protein